MCPISKPYWSTRKPLSYPASQWKLMRTFNFHKAQVQLQSAICTSAFDPCLKVRILKYKSRCGCCRATYRGAQVICTPHRRDGTRGGEQTPVKSAQVNLAFPGVTVTQIDPQDAGSSVAVIDLYGSTGGQGRRVWQLKLPTSVCPPHTALFISWPPWLYQRLNRGRAVKWRELRRRKTAGSEGFITRLQLLPHQPLTLALPNCYGNSQSPLGIAQASSSASSASYHSSSSSSWPLVVTGLSHTTGSSESMRVDDKMHLKVCLSVLMCCVSVCTHCCSEACISWCLFLMSAWLMCVYE